MTQLAERPAETSSPRASNVRALPQRCKLCHVEQDAAAVAICEHCLGPLEPLYPEKRRLPSRERIESRRPSLWRYREWLPFDYGVIAEGAEPDVLSRDTGFTPLVDAPRLAARLGIARAWIKNDAVSHPTLSFKDRVVATAINAARSFGLDTIGCASTGNLANAVAAHAARAGLQSWIFIPEDLEEGKVIGTLVYGPNLVRIRGHYDDVNRLCAQLADRFGWGIVNVNLRGYYGEGSKTMAFEIAEQLGWRLPDAVIAPMAGGSLLTKLRKGFGEFVDAGLVAGELPRMYGAQADGCAPIVRLFESEGDTLVPETPRTIARSIAIGNPADGSFAVKAMRESGGWAQSVSDEALVEGIRVLASTTGIFTETAGGVTVAAALALAASGRFKRDDEIVLCITGNGLKTTDAVRDALPAAPLVNAKVREVAALVAEREQGRKL
jgi:threonine synthase